MKTCACLGSLLFALICAGVETNSVSFTVNILVNTNNMMLATGHKADLLVTVKNSSQRPIEIASVRFAGKELEVRWRQMIKEAYGTNAWSADVDQLQIRFKGEKREYMAAVPFPFSGALEPGQSVRVITSFTCPADPGVYRLEFRPIDSPGEVRDNFFSTTDEPQVVRPGALGSAFIESIRVVSP